MEELTSLKALSEVGVAGILIVILYYMMKYINKKDDVIQQMINVNQTQNDQMKDTNNLIRELTEHQKECRDYSRLGYWWEMNHQPTPDICDNCDDYATCPHPRKVILKRR